LSAGLLLESFPTQSFSRLNQQPESEKPVIAVFAPVRKNEEHLQQSFDEAAPHRPTDNTRRTSGTPHTHNEFPDE
jgi:hypothetical protein